MRKFYVVFQDGSVEIVRGKTMGHAADKLFARDILRFAIYTPQTYKEDVLGKIKRDSY